jgi:hypothetical protein
MDFPKRWRADKPVRFRVTVQARSAEALSPVYIFDVGWDGQWSDDDDAPAHGRATGRPMNPDQLKKSVFKHFRIQPPCSCTS